MTAVLVPTRTQLFIAGEYSDGSGQERYDVTSPSTGELITSIPVPTEADLDLAVAKARAAKGAWQKLGVFKRAEICHKIGDAMEARVDELARIQSAEHLSLFDANLRGLAFSRNGRAIHGESLLMTGATLVRSSPFGTDVPGDGVKPRSKARRPGHLIESPERPHEDFLAGVLGLGLRGPPTAQREHDRRVSGVESPERLRVARPGGRQVVGIIRHH